MNEMAKMMILTGGILLVVGVILLITGKIPGAGRFPGDFLVKKDNFTFYFPLTTCLLISVVVSIILYLWNRK
ncbi:MAG TPA: DUF2905 domain-containing protein [Candidatus Omnitrophota bacterium]|nr:DUF2905 domain-containing protein [Candidatus Omnitrophota bacterium]HPD85018.1 DUF2905 domain-containing protein [Candidatus Omnitrophota bacterium]HRZ03876.1 DUF2905 domain-containing protein [Candidatus Omnitrophota bacterium]